MYDGTTERIIKCARVKPNQSFFKRDSDDSVNDSVSGGKKKKNDSVRQNNLFNRKAKEEDYC